MKRLWFIILSLSLVAGLGLQAMAVDVKFSGEYYAAGLYLDKTSFQKNTADEGPSTAFYFQRLRVKTEFVISPGLSLTTRFDVMERAWGATRSASSTALDTASAGTRAENENIAFDHLYVTYFSPVGIFKAGYADASYFGAVFGDSRRPAGQIEYAVKIGDFVGVLNTGKMKENSATAINAAMASDRDDNYALFIAFYGWKNGEAGLQGIYERDASNRTIVAGTDVGYLSSLYVMIPYVKMRLGPVALQAEVDYLFGKLTNWEGSFSIGQPDISLNQVAAMIDAQADLGKFYLGGTVAYASGDDPATADKMEGGIMGGGLDWNPCLILFNNDLNYWAGSQAGYDGAANAGAMTNAWFFQLRGGVRPTDKLDVMASVSYARADKTPQAVWVSRDYGYEVDLTATYRITNNLSYMLGGGYFFAGDYYKGTSAAHEINNNLMVINKLSLTF